MAREPFRKPLSNTLLLPRSSAKLGKTLGTTLTIGD